MSSYFVRAIVIRDWAKRIGARSALPHLVRRLVLNSVESLIELDFPAYESVSRSGYDGTVKCVEGNAWVPDGKTVWEMGVNSGIKSKADSDYETRTESEDASEMAETVFVFVTPRHWEKKKEWAETRTKEGKWKEVRAYDSDDLEQWIERVPSVAVWFGRQVGARPVGVDDVEARWEAIAGSAPLPLIPSVFLGGRDRNVEEFVDWLEGDASPLRVVSRSPVEVIDFACAAIASIEEADRERFQSRCIIVETREAWVALRDASVSATLLIDPRLQVPFEEIKRACTNGHHVLYAIEPNPKINNGFELVRSDQHAVKEALEKCGYTPVDAEQIARNSGGSLAVLKKLLEHSAERPAWIGEVPARVCAACLLLGGWDGSNEADKTAIEHISGLSYAETEPYFQRMATAQDPILFHADKKWRLISKDYSWTVLQEKVSAESVRDFIELVVEILNDDDPSYDLPARERIFASFSGHKAKYSATIKQHTAEVLALLGQFGDRFQAASSTKIVDAVDRVVSNVLSNDSTWLRWASLGDRLAFLAEASPTSFLTAVRADLKRVDSQICLLLREEEDPFWGRCKIAGILWALETLAWSRKHLPDVAKSLLILASHDPGGRWANRPANSLKEILLYWMPHTTASVEERIKVLDLLVRVNQDAAWSLLVGLLPSSGGSVSTSTRRPYWRNWANSWERGTSAREYLAFVTATMSRLIELAGTDSERWSELLEHLSGVPQSLETQFLEAVKQLPMAEISDSDRKQLSEALRKQIGLHRRHHDASWSVPSAMLDELDEVRHKLIPDCPVDRNAWLFRAYPREFFDGELGYDEAQRKLDEAQEAAIIEIVESKGFQGIKALMLEPVRLQDVGRALARTRLSEFDWQVIPAMLTDESNCRNFAAGYVWRRYVSAGWTWLDQMLEKCPDDVSKARLLTMIEFSPQTWQCVDQFGADVVSEYWKLCSGYGDLLDAESKQLAASRLIEHRRSRDALLLLNQALQSNEEIKTEILLLSLEAFSRGEDENSQTTLQMVRHDIQEIIGFLQKVEGVDFQRMAVIELNFLNLLDDQFGHSPKLLHAQMANSPEFFVDVIGNISHPKKERLESRTISESDQRVINQIYELLHGWKQVPGTQEGVVSEEKLRTWCEGVHKLSEDRELRQMCDHYIGQVFAHSPEDEDGTWPCKAVCRIAEDFQSEEIESGLYCAILNLRGVGFRGSGGDQERKLAQQFREKAERVRFDSTFVGSILDAVADHYEREANDWDEHDRWRDN